MLTIGKLSHPVQYNANNGAVKAVNNQKLSELNEVQAKKFNSEPLKVVELSEQNVTRPITNTFVDNIDSPTETVVDLSTMKTQKKQQIKNKAYNLLSEYDWYVIRKEEEGTAIPSKVLQYRSDVRTTEDNATDSVESAETPSEIRSIEPYWPDEPEIN